MQNGWYGFIKQTYFKNKMVYVEDNVITVTKDELSGEVEEIKEAVTPNMEKKMALLELFDGLGLA